MTPKQTLLLAALKFRDSQLWATLDDSMIFSVVLPSGEIGYCCVMGKGGEHYALGLYRGDKGFATYLKTLYPVAGANEIDRFEQYMTFDCINCEFVPASDRELTKEAKEEVKKIAAENGMKIRRPNGWPNFVRMNQGTNSIGLTDAQDIADMTMALRAGAEIASKVGGLGAAALLDAGFEGEYAPIGGGMVIPLLSLDDDGKFVWGKTATSALVADDYDIVQYNDLETAAILKHKRHAGTYQCRFAHLPTPIAVNGKLVFTQIIALVGKSNQVALPVMAPTEEPTKEDYLRLLGSQLKDLSSVPSTIEVVDACTHALLDDFCAKTGIKLKSMREVDCCDEVLMFMHAQMR